MLATLQRILMRALALLAIATGALVALFLALFTLISGMLIGAVTLIMARFGRGPLGRHRMPPGGTGGPAGGTTVIDVDMREIEPGKPHGDPAGGNPSRSSPAG